MLRKPKVYRRERFTFSLQRDVYEGEELFIDYGVSYDRSRYGPPRFPDKPQ